jgi:hypothetical protein
LVRLPRSKSVLVKHHERVVEKPIALADIGVKVLVLQRGEVQLLTLRPHAEEITEIDRPRFPRFARVIWPFVPAIGPLRG